MVLSSDVDSYTCVIELSDGSEAWCIRRAAIKLAGPLGRMLELAQTLDWDTMRTVGEYHTDFEEAVEIFRSHLGPPGSYGFDSRVDELMNCSCAMAHDLLSPNQHKLRILTEAAEGRHQLSRDEIIVILSRK
jgi:hypothetical protein